MSDLHVLLCWGCGGLPWARLQPGQVQRHQVGSLGSWIGLSANGARFGLDISRMVAGESPICLSALIHAEQQWLPAPGWLGKVEVELIAEGSRGAPPAPVMPDLAELSAGLADHCTQQLGEPGTLAVPWAWREVPLAQRLLGPWAQRGWHFAALEQLVQRAAGGTRRIITSDGPYLRLHGPIAQVVMPGSIEAAGALTLAGEVLPRMLQQAGPTVASHWRQHEQERQLPLVRSMLARKILQALRLGAHAISLGGADAPIFFAPGPGTPDALQALHDHRFRVFLPRMPELSWWSKVTEAGFLRSPSGRVLIFGLDWKAVPTVEVEGPSSPWDLPAHLKTAGSDRSALRAHALHEHVDVGEPLQSWFPSWVPQEAEIELPEPEPAPPMPDPEPPPPSPAPPLPEPEPPPPSPVPPPPLPEPDIATATAQPATSATIAQPPPPVPEPEPEAPPAPPEPAGDDFSSAWQAQRAPTLPPPPTLEPPPVLEPEAPAPPPAAAKPQAPAPPPAAAQPEAPRPEPPQAAEAGLATFDPQQITVRPPHRPDSLRLVVDGEPVPGASLVPVGQGPDGRGHYLVEDCPLRHGALVRVDFEPCWERS